jgi:hypothetical protein
MNGIQVAIVHNFFISIFNLEITSKNSCWKKNNKNLFFFCLNANKVIYVSPWSSKINSHNDNPLEWWMVFNIANWIENKVLIIKND